MGLGTERANIDKAKAAILALHPTTLSEIICAAADMQTSYPRDPYKLGEEAWGYTWGKAETSRLDDVDCSGEVYSLGRLADELGRKAGIPERLLWKDGGTWRRSTAAGYHSVSVPVTDGNYRTFDIITFKNSGGVYHIAILTKQVNGVWRTVEARSGVEAHTVPELLARPGATGVRRFPWLDLGGTAGGIHPDPIFQHAMWYTGKAPYFEGEDVRHYQEIVKPYLAGGVYPFGKSVASWLTVNGVYGPTFYWAVRVAQWSLGLPGTGGIDWATAAALDNL